MVATDKLFAGSIPDIYEHHLVPLIFEPYARDLARRVAEVGPHDILETAAGTGVATRAMADALPASARMVATDLNQAMLDVAAKRLSRPGLAWQQADALALPFPDQSFDAVVCQFGVMFFPDKLQGFLEAHRLLKSQGRFLFNVWDAIADNEFADVVTEAVAELFPNDPPRFLARTPHGYHDVEQISAMLTAAGFSHVAADTIEHQSQCASPRDAAFAYCQGTPLRNEIAARDAARLDEATDHAAAALARRFGDGAIAGRIQAVVFTAAR